MQVTSYYYNDGLDSITEITDELGNLVERYEYDVFGRVSITDSDGNLLTESSINNPYYFTGRRYDTETGLYFFRTRYYNADIGRFIQPDTIGYKADVNLYTYCHNNPINYIDPYGTCDWEWWRRMIEDVMKWLREGLINPSQALDILSTIASELGLGKTGLITGAIGSIFNPGGTGELVGGIVGGTLGAGVGACAGYGLPGAIVGGIIGGALGSQIGSRFDSPDAGYAY